MEEAVTYTVSGMTCGGCERAVVRAIGRAQPGAQARADHAAGVVVVSGAHDAAAVAQAVTDAGFGFGGAA